MLKYPSGRGEGLNFIHQNQPPNYIVNIKNHNYVKTLKKVSKTIPKSLSFFSPHFFPFKSLCLVCDSIAKPHTYLHSQEGNNIFSPPISTFSVQWSVEQEHMFSMLKESYIALLWI